MKIRSVLLAFTLMTFLVGATGCETHFVLFHRHHRNLPPGQAKKIHGSKSAKPFAPGQKKKNHE